MKRRLVQITAGAARGDAVTNYVRFIDARLGASGIFSSTRIFAENIADDRPGRVSHVCTYTPSPGDLVVYHHSVGFRHLPGILFPGVKPLLIYHNITPAKFYAPWDFRAAGRMELGRHQLSLLAKVCPGAIALSEFSARELRSTGFSSVEVLPYPAGASILKKFDFAPEKKSGGSVPVCADAPGEEFSVVFVGRIAPNKRIEKLLDVFALLRRRMLREGRHVRLTLAGSLTTGCYANFIQKRSVALGLSDDVCWTGYVDDQSLARIWSGADLYLSLSEHEGFGVPLMEAMGRDIPILALCANGSSVEEVLGGCGVGFREVSIDWVADSARRMLTDSALRDLVIDGQRKRLAELQAIDVAGRILEILEKLMHDG